MDPTERNEGSVHGGVINYHHGRMDYLNYTDYDRKRIMVIHSI